MLGVIGWLNVVHPDKDAILHSLRVFWGRGLDAMASTGACRLKGGNDQSILEESLPTNENPVKLMNGR